MGGMASKGEKGGATAAEEREKTENVGVSLCPIPPILLAPPPKGACPLARLHQDILDRIFKEMGAKELSCLMRTSRHFHQAVLNFVHHFVLTDDRLRKLLHFLNNNPLLIPELALKQKLDRIDPDGTCSNPTLIHYKAVQRLVCPGILERVPVCKADHFPHLDNPSYLKIEKDFMLNRNIVVLETVCWLHFTKRFASVPKGTYEFSLRVKTQSHISWMGRQPGKIRVLKLSGKEPDPKSYSQALPSNPEELASTEISPIWWTRLKSRRQGNLRNASVRFDAGSDWFSIILDPFKIEDEEPVTLKFEFRDFDNPNWKGGIAWDFIQMRKVD